MPFQFIDNNAAINSTARRTIRSHAAKGKNVGKTMKRQSKKSVFSDRITTIYRSGNTVQSSHTPPDSEENMVFVPMVDRMIGDLLSTFHFPTHVPPESRPLVMRGLSSSFGVRDVPEVRAAFERGRRGPSIWIQLMFMDAAYFHIAMAMSISFVNKTSPVARAADWEIRHVSHTLFLVNQRLSSTDATCNATLAAVTMMAQYEHHQGRHEQGLLHMNGLMRLVDMRGGIRNMLREHVVLAQKIVRLDLVYTLEMGSATMFRTEDVVHARAPTLSFRECFAAAYRVAASQFALPTNISPALLAIATDMATLSRLLNDAITGYRPKLDMIDGCIAMWEIGYRLLHFSPLSEPSPAKNNDDVVRLGLLMFMAPFLHTLDGRIPYFPLIYRLACSAAESYLENPDEPAEHSVFLWMALVGASSAFQPPNHEQMVPAVRRSMHNLNIETWEEVAEVLTGFPWIDALFLAAGQSLFNAARRTPRRLEMIDVN